MQKVNIRKILAIITVVTVVGFGAYAFAHWGMGYGHHGWGSGYHHGWFGEPGYQSIGDLSEDEIKNFNEERDAFLKETADIRQDIYMTELELSSELAKQDPDPQTATHIQKELSALETRLDQKRIDHMVKIRKINPRAGNGFMAMHPMGYGNSSMGYCW